jgi:predicted esterase
MTTLDSADPHRGQLVMRAGEDPAQARLAVIMIHGRGGSAEDILSLSAQLEIDGAAYLAPQAAGHTWYPLSFLAPIARNEPGISSGMRVIEGLIDEVGRAGLPPDRVVLIGFSQGACLALEFAARHAQRYALVAGLSGGLIGPPGTPRAYEGSMKHTPVFLGCSDVDPHIPVERVHETGAVFRALDAAVHEHIYPDMDHTVTAEELHALRRLLGHIDATPR